MERSILASLKTELGNCVSLARAGTPIENPSQIR